MKTKDAIAAIGSAKALADALGVTQSAISQWGDNVPPLRVFQLQVVRPSLFPTTTPHQEAA